VQRAASGAPVVAGCHTDTEFVLVSFDIPDDRRRGRVHRLLSGFGAWVQYSVFECYLTKRQQVELAARLAREIRPAQDPVAAHATPAAPERAHRGGPVGFVGESVAELKKVEWPGQQQVIQGTAVVIIACVIVGIYLYGADLIFKRVVQNLLLGQ